MENRPTRPRNFRITEIADIISAFKVMTKEQNLGIKEACRRIAADYGRPPDTIYHLISRVTREGQNSKVLNEIQELSKRYGITTPYSPDLETRD